MELSFNTLLIVSYFYYGKKHMNKNTRLNNIIIQQKNFYISCLLIFSLLSIISIDINQIDLKHNYNNLVNAWANEINGTETSDNITGTANKDIIKALKGNDTISGIQAGDDISGGSGDDTIYGNEGRDSLMGKSGNDNIDGGEGNDRIYGDKGNDKLIGGTGNDTITGGSGKDVFICGTSTDTISDFNVTEKDTTPENDCEIINDSNKTAENKDNLQIQEQQPQQPQQPQQTNLPVTTTNTAPIAKEKNPDIGPFIGIFNNFS